MTNLFSKNRNELSKYFYDLSKAALLSSVIVPIFQEKLSFKLSLAGTFMTVLFLVLGMISKKET